ncbi:hypothetical protein NL676_037430 [Syzygium grande]|nr:hypothetical protein NL676_037430 [Syzygium grande]
MTVAERAAGKRRRLGGVESGREAKSNSLSTSSPSSTPQLVLAKTQIRPALHLRGWLREREKAGVFRTSSSAGPGAGPSAAGPRFWRNSLHELSGTLVLLPPDPG